MSSVTDLLQAQREATALPCRGLLWWAPISDIFETIPHPPPTDDEAYS